MRKSSWILLFLLTLLSATGFIAYDLYLIIIEDRYIDIKSIQDNFRDGDVIFQTSTSAQSKAIQLATKSKYSHMGMIYVSDGDYFVFEAVQPVKLTPLQEWIDRGEGGMFVVKRLKNADEYLTKERILKMKQIGQFYIGKDYDIYFEWSDTRIYCSELVWKIYQKACGIEIGKLQKLSDFDLSDKLVRQKLTERYGDKIPEDEMVISPESMFQSEMLMVVFKN